MSSLHDAFSAQKSFIRFMYCAPAWPGTFSAADRNRLDSLLFRAKHLGFCNKDL